MNPEIEKGDTVTVESLDGDTGRAAVVRVLDEPAGEHVLFSDDDGEPVTLAAYWGGVVPDGDAVIRVRYLLETDDGDEIAGQKSYDFPASAVVAQDGDAE